MNVSINYDGVLVTDSTSRWYGNVDISNFRFPFTISTFVKSNDSGYRAGQLKCYYIDENKRFLNSKFGSSSSESNQMTALTILENNLPVGTKYIEFRITLKNSYTEKTQIELNTTRTNYVEHEEQTISIPTQQPMRSIGDVRDKFVKVNGVWNEKHLPYIASYNGETLPTDVYTEEGGIKYCNSKSMSTTGQFSNGASVQYVDENNWNYLPCTETQIQQLENKPSTYKDFTIIQSEDETPAYLEVSGIYDLNKLINN